MSPATVSRMAAGRCLPPAVALVAGCPGCRNAGRSSVANDRHQYPAIGHDCAAAAFGPRI